MPSLTRLDLHLWVCYIPYVLPVKNKKQFSMDLDNMAKKPTDGHSTSTVRRLQALPFNQPISSIDSNLFRNSIDQLHLLSKD